MGAGFVSPALFVLAASAIRWAWRFAIALVNYAHVRIGSARVWLVRSVSVGRMSAVRS